MPEGAHESRPPTLLRVLDRWGGMWNGVFALFGGLWLLLADTR